MRKINRSVWFSDEIFNQAGIKYELIDGYLVLTAIPAKNAGTNESKPSRFTISGTVSDSSTS